MTGWDAVMAGTNFDQCTGAENAVAKPGIDATFNVWAQL
jgi:hypothetical protein